MLLKCVDELGDLVTTALDETTQVASTTTAAAAPMNAAAASSKCLALHQDMALVQMYGGKDQLFSLPAWKVY